MVTTEELTALAQVIAEKCRLSQYPVSYTSRGVRYSFYRNRRAQVLMVKITGSAHKVRPDIEALAKKLLERRVCPACAAVFPTKGKQRFCGPACAARYRARRYRRKVAAAHRADKLRDLLRRTNASVEAAALALRRANRAKARRRQRAKVKHSQAVTREEQRHASLPYIDSRGR